ncbi:MAG: 50S ribosomal protein L7ae [Thaumarchaeota archaeon]|nr:50S ribosomal protein L7ae [Nitrososphaerota archaeon]
MWIKMSKVLEQVIKDSLSTKKCKIGGIAVLRSVKDSKLIVCSESLPVDTKNKITESAKSLNIPIYNFANTSMELGRFCKKPFKISVISIDNTSDSDISGVLEEINKEDDVKHG